MITHTATTERPSTWYFREQLGGGRPVRNGFTGYAESSAAALADALGVQLVILGAADGEPQLDG